MTEYCWRKQSIAVIKSVVAAVGTEDPIALRRAISEAYPFGLRQHYPYKVWLEEVNNAFEHGCPQEQTSLFDV